ncbi:alkyl hydroperoxide reductase subunit AhpC [Bradyrhizobium sp. USDA 4522]
MALQIGAVAPDFEAETTEGKIKFHDWIGNSWALLFSHPKDFTPVCTTELGALARLKPEFDKRGVKLMGLSVDPVDRHAKWSDDIKETQGAAPNYPMIGDTDFNVSKLYDMLPASTSGDPLTRTPADNQTVRNVFVIGPDKKIKLVMVYPMTTGRNFQEILRSIDSLQMTAKHRVATPADWKQGEDVIIADRGLGQRRRGQDDLPAGLEGAEALHPHRAAAEVTAGSLRPGDPRTADHRLVSRRSAAVGSPGVA